MRTLLAFFVTTASTLDHWQFSVDIPPYDIDVQETGWRWTG
jgi:hypothetical protein